MITPGQIEEWIREVEERPGSAALILRQIAQRLGELAQMNEQLLAENIALKSGEKAAEYEGRIANLEYQLEMLKRQVGDLPSAPEATEALSLLVYETGGHIIRVPIHPERLISGEPAAIMPEESLATLETPQFMVVDSKDELLFVFDSGRAVTMPVADIPPAESVGVDWEQAIQQETRGSELLATVLPIGRMSLFEYCVQVSRRGYVKKIKETFLESYISNGNVGTGVVAPSDKAFCLALCAGEDLLVIVSQEGSLLSVAVEELSYTIQEALRLGSTDHVIASLVTHEHPSFLAVTQNGKVFHRDRSWLEPAGENRSQGRSILSKTRLQAGLRLVAAAAVDERDWSVALASDGRFMLHQMGEVFGAGALLENDSDLEILGFTTFSV